MDHPVLLLWLFIWYKSGKIELFDYLSTSVGAEGQKALLLKSICDCFKFCLVFFLQLLLIDRDLILFRYLCLLWHLDVSCPTGRAKRCVDAKSTHWNLKSLFAKLQNADQACQSIWPINWQGNSKPSNSRVYRLDFRITLMRGIGKALPIQKMTKNRIWWACNKSNLLRIGNELPIPMSN